MYKKIICLILLLKISTICECFAPKFFGQDSAIIVDTDKTLARNKYYALQYPTTIKLPPPFPLWRHYPRYHIIPPPPPGQVLAINTWAKTAKATDRFTPHATNFTRTTTTTATPRPTMPSRYTLSPFLKEDEYPSEFLDIAQSKLGLKNIEEIPSISELGQIVGTSSPEETLKYIKKLALNEQGVALLKAYIESADYTDKTAESVNNNGSEEKEDDNDEMSYIEQPSTIKDQDLVVVTDEDLNVDSEISNDENLTQEGISQASQELSENHQSFVGRLANFIQRNSWFKNAEKQKQNEEFNLVNRITENGKKVPKKNYHLKETPDDQLNPEVKTPILVRDSIPFNYPIPIRIQSSTTTTIPPTSDTPAVHLNSPKVLIPHVYQISRVTNIPTKQIEDFVASKPKLLDLLTKVSRFPIGYDRSSPIEAQVIAAVQKAFEEDDDLKKLLMSSKATLK